MRFLRGTGTVAYGGLRCWPAPLAARGGALEIKAYRGSPGILEVAGRARGRLESWQKWSFPFSRSAPAAAARPAGGR